MRLALVLCAFVALPAASQEPSVDLDEFRAQQEMFRQEMWEKGAVFRERKEQVEARLKQACDTMFLSSPDKTILNPICYDVFLNHGLPD